jgi:hypothetical protein
MRFETLPLPAHSALELSVGPVEAHPCPNCGAEVTAHFCGTCGQSRHDHSRTTLELIHELIAHHLFLDGKMTMTLVALLFRPGVLTRAFIEGRRVRYVSPIRLYLFASFAFFLALWMSGFALIQFHIPSQIVAAIAGQSNSDPAPVPSAEVPMLQVLRPAHDGEALPEAVRSRLSVKGALTEDGKTTPDGEKAIAFAQRMTDGFSIMLAHPRALNPVLDEWLPRLLIVTLPFTALLLALFGRKRGLYFVDHVSFALHLQAFFFVAGLVIIAVRLLWPALPLGWPLITIFSVYSYLAYLRTYPGNWLWAGIKLGIIGSTYGLSLAIWIVALLIYGVSTLPGGA